MQGGSDRRRPILPASIRSGVIAQALRRGCEIGSSAAATFENPYNPRQGYGNCNFDLRQNFNTPVVAAMPDVSSGGKRAVINGWQLSAILTYHMGHFKYGGRRHACFAVIQL